MESSVEIKGPPLRPNFKTLLKRESSNSSFSSNLQLSSEGSSVRHNFHNLTCVNESISRPQLMKNLIVLGVGFTLVFSEFLALQSLQTSLYVQTHIGATSLTCISSIAALTSLTGPVVVQLISATWTMIFTYVVFALFFATQFYPQMYSIVPSSILLGLFLGPFFSAHTSYFMTLAHKFVLLLPGESRERILNRVTRTYHLMINSSQIWGHLITALVLGLTKDSYLSAYIVPPDFDFDVIFPQDTRLKCDDCDSNWALFGDRYAPKDNWTRYVEDMTSDIVFYTTLSSGVSLVLISIYLGLVLMGIAVTTAFLERVELNNLRHLDRKSAWTLLKTILHYVTDQKLLLILPLSYFIGLEQGFIYADFTKSYVTCTLGLPGVCYTLMCLGILQTLVSFTLSHFVKHLQRLAVLAAGFIFHTGLLTILWLWRPSEDDIQVFYTISAGWGLCDAIWRHLSFTLLTTLFFDSFQGPFAWYNGANFAGLATAFGLHNYVCKDTKILMLAACLPLCVFPFGFLEHKVQEFRRNRANNI